MIEEKPIIAERIKFLRKEKCYTQEQLAELLGLNAKSSIANYESGANAPSDEIKSKMCELFGCSMDYLMGKSNFRTNAEELTNYLNIEIKDDLIKNLKALELDKSDLEKAITAFVENYMVPTDELSVKIYDMEDSLIYFAYELITKYYFKLINKELSVLTNNSELLADKQAYFEKAEQCAWNKMKRILEEIDESTIISNLTSAERAHKFISNLETTSKYYMVPVYRSYFCRTT
jgi:transcriptional regulator with XRE-family HTH domain